MFSIKTPQNKNICECSRSVSYNILFCVDGPRQEWPQKRGFVIHCINIEVSNWEFALSFHNFASPSFINAFSE
jgi:hypothetical protein